MSDQSKAIIKKLGLSPHPEGGFYKPTSMSEDKVMTKNGKRSLFTNIYFLLRSVDLSHFHRLQSDEIWYYHAGSPLTVHMIHPDGTYKNEKIGPRVEDGEYPQFKVPKHTIFGSAIEEEDTYSLVSCMVSPGFDFSDFELFTQEELLNSHPQHEQIIRKMAYEKLP